MKHARQEVRTAYHEAGHALIGLHFVHLSALGIERKVKYGGQTFTQKKGWIRFARGSKVSIEGNILIDLAGPAAEKMCPFGPGRDYYLTSMEDIQRVERALGELYTEAELYIYLRKFRAKVEGMLKHHWPEVKAIAKAVLERKRLTGLQAEKIAKEIWEKEKGKHPITDCGKKGKGDGKKRVSWFSVNWRNLGLE